MAYKRGDEFVSGEAAYTPLWYKIENVKWIKIPGKKDPVLDHYVIENMNISKKDFNDPTYKKLRFFEIEPSRFDTMIQNKLITPKTKNP